ncbi:glycosyltransferase family 2 protein, partial [Patescibacteria group bacterium]|nr:glycosyltransferase family 2 protein [Patescibacteria group bacterium]
MSKAIVWIVVLHYKDQPMTSACLRSLEKLDQTGLELKILVIFNNPAENPAKMKKEFPQALFLETGENKGFAGGNNVGLKYALDQKADWILLLNNDTEVKKDFLAQLLAVAKKEEQGGMFCPKILFAKGFEYHKDRYAKKDLGRVIWYAGAKVDWANIATPHRGVDEVDQGQFDQPEKIEFGSGCAALLKGSVLTKVGLLDERYFLYYEDADLS